MGVVKQGLSVTVLATAAVLYKLLGCPPRDITLERQSVEYDLREGRVYTEFLREAEWVPYTGTHDIVDDLEDVPVSLAPPRKYRLTEEELKKVCPYTEKDLRDTSDGFRIINSTPKVAFLPQGRGNNAVGCGNMSYVPADEISEEDGMENFFLHFDGFAHKTLNQEYKQREHDAVSNFFSNFSHDVFTAPLHATMVSSTVVMCAGVKTWFFMDPSCCNEFGHHMYAGALLGKGFHPNTKILVLQSEPGDVLTFGSFHHHMVMTHTGPAFMQTYRHLGPPVVWEGIKQYGWSYMKALVDVILNNPGGTANQAQEHPLRKECRNAMADSDTSALSSRIASFFGKK